MRWMMLSDDEINPAITSSSKLPYIDMEEEDDVDFTSENEPEPRCNDSNNDTPQEQIVVRRRLEVVKEELLNLCLQIQCLVYQSLQMKMKHHLHIYLRLIVLI